MKYKKLAKEMKGIHIKWEDGKIFPKYKYVSGSHVSQKRINKAKKIVLSILEEEENKIRKEFKNLLEKKFKGKYKSLKINFKLAKEKIKSAKLSKESDGLHGESNYYQIWISSNKLSDDELVGTMLHESLHFISTYDRNEICEKDEHYVMAKLGDDC